MAKPIYIENLVEWRESFKYSYPVTVRFSETDAFGHMNNCISFVYFEEARINFFQRKLVWQKSGFLRRERRFPLLPIYNVIIGNKYFFDDSLQVYVKADTIGKTSVDLHYMILNEKGDICMTGRGRMVQISKATGKPVPWSETAMKCIQKSL
ncbi:MAG: acyl-CoA thioesterase [Bacillus sp. (in: Bacteria)]|nr:acyl-CoA thioesterase [Bacillus sp. (in: firmicutes)]